ncbi:hypothetical protein BH23DEI1_BH23DEI1_10480 [soil metagenome]|nr:hypothetical protein [Trueperaceae bacterium]
MARRPSNPPLNVEDAKARLRLAAARAEPSEIVSGAIRTSPWSGVGVFLVLGLIIGATPSLRRSAGSLVTTGLKGLRPG